MTIHRSIGWLAWLLLAMAIAVAAQTPREPPAEPAAGKVLLLEIDGGIGPPS